MVSEMHPQQGTIKVAAAQYAFDQLHDTDAWVEKLRTWVRDGAALGADVLVFPEYAAMEVSACFGDEISSDLQKSLQKVADLSDWRTTQHQDLAVQFGITLIAGSGPVRRYDGAIVNEAVIVTPNGKVGRQHKLMMTPFERSWGVSPGETLHVFDLKQTRVAIAICYDIEFPLLVRAAAVAGAEIILVPSCTEHASGYHRVRTGAMARALENTLATVQSATIGDAVWCPAIDHNTGAGGVFVPAERGLSDTGVLAQGQLNEPGWVTAKLDLQALRTLRESGEMRNFADWNTQPGGSALTFAAKRVNLT